MQKRDPLKNKRIFVGFNSAGSAGIYAYTRVLRRRGYQTDFYGTSRTNFNMPTDYLLTFSDSIWLSFFQRFWIFMRLLSKYDVWHFNYMEVFFFYPLNLFLLKLLGKKIVITFRGSEIRSGFDFFSKKMMIQKGNWPDYYRQIHPHRLKDYLKILRMMIFCALADQVVLTGPFLASSVSRYNSIIPYARNLSELKKFQKKVSKIKRVLHVPTEPHVKGTKEIEKNFKKLAKKYKKVSFEILSPMPREKLLKKISQADVLVDQLLVGWYGGQAVESLAMGKITLAFLHPPYFALVPFLKDIPIWQSSYWSFYQDMENLLNLNQKSLLKLSEQGIDFTQKYHDAAKIAQRYLEVYKACYQKKC